MDEIKKDLFKRNYNLIDELHKRTKVFLFILIVIFDFQMKKNLYHVNQNYLKEILIIYLKNI